MERAVEDRVGQDLVVEDLAPVREALVAGHDEAGPFVAADEEPEEEASLLPGQREVPELIQDEHSGIDQLMEGALQPVLVAGSTAWPSTRIAATRLEGRPPCSAKRTELRIS